ncbi:hypothetical protein ACH5RR_034512 [Cinchona calisaya]|uniref:Uncharacterized protein n=1 Tax=Cinchona calisaya TaxID=153742 RepID=A0ABD2YDA2_9GENT
MFAHISRKLHINGCTSTRVFLLFSKPLFQYSTKTAAAAAKSKPQKNHFLEEYLINSLGFSKQEAFSTSKKVPLKPFRKDPNLVIHFLEFHGFNKSQIKSIVSSLPKLLFCNPDRTLKPKLQFFHGLGLSGSEIVKLFVFQKHLFTSGSDFVRARFDYFRTLLGSDEKVTRALKRCSSLLRYDASEKVAEAVVLLRNYGFSDENVANFIIRSPRRVFILQPEEVEDMARVVENDFGIARESAMFYYGVEVLTSLTKSTVDRKLSIWRSFGWSDVDIRTMLRKHPLCVRLSVSKIREGLKFFMEELGYTSGYLASHPTFFTLSLEKRIKPRNEVVKLLNEKMLIRRKASLYSVVSLTEERFLKKYLLPYREKMPDLYRSYMHGVGG